MTQPETGYLIHKAGRGYYAPRAQGYTLDADKAGRFSRAEAYAYSHPNGPDGPRDGITFTHESNIERGSSCEADLRIHDLTRERDRLRQAQEDLAQALADATAQIETLTAQLRGADAAAKFMASHNAS